MGILDDLKVTLFRFSPRHDRCFLFDVFLPWRFTRRVNRRVGGGDWRFTRRVNRRVGGVDRRFTRRVNRL